MGQGKKVFRNATAVKKLYFINLDTDKCSWKDVDVGVAATSALNKCKVFLGEKIKIREDFINFVIYII